MHVWLPVWVRDLPEKLRGRLSGRWFLFEAAAPGVFLRGACNAAFSQCHLEGTDLRQLVFYRNQALMLEREACGSVEVAGIPLPGDPRG